MKNCQTTRLQRPWTRLQIIAIHYGKLISLQEIRNPYFAVKMLTYMEVKAEFKPSKYSGFFIKLPLGSRMEKD